jgi:hypothetical protein
VNFLSVILKGVIAGDRWMICCSFVSSCGMLGPGRFAGRSMKLRGLRAGSRTLVAAGPGPGPENMQKKFFT